MMKWYPTVMMKQKMNLKTRDRQLNQNRTEPTENQRKTGSQSRKTARGKSKQMTEASTNNLSL